MAFSNLGKRGDMEYFRYSGHKKPEKTIAEQRQDIEDLKERIRNEPRQSSRTRMAADLQDRVRKLISKLPCKTSKRKIHNVDAS